MRADNLNYALMIYLLMGEYERAIAKMDAALALTRAIGNEWGETFAQTWIGAVFVELGEITRALDVMHEAIRLGARSLNAPLITTRADLARLYTDLGETERALGLAQAALQTAAKRFPAMRHLPLGALIHALCARGQVDAARAALRASPTPLVLNENSRFRANS